MFRCLPAGWRLLEVHSFQGCLSVVSRLQDLRGCHGSRSQAWGMHNDVDDHKHVPKGLRANPAQGTFVQSNWELRNSCPLQTLPRAFASDSKGKDKEDADPELAGKGPDNFGQDDVEGDVEDEGKSVLDQIDEDGNLREEVTGENVEGGEDASAAGAVGDDDDDDDDDGSREEGDDDEDRTDAELRSLEGEEKYNAMFNQWYRSPTKNRHLLREILSPRILDDLERWTVDRASDIDPSDFHDFLVDIRASQKVVKSGRIVRYRAMVVVGDLKGLCGYASSKAATVQAAIENAKKRAIKSLIFIPRYREHTIFEPSTAKCTSTKVLMWPRSRGFGLHCNDLLFQVCELVGVQDISIKVIGSRSKFNTVHAFFEALENTKSALEAAEEKGVYLRERCLFRPPTSMKDWV